MLKYRRSSPSVVESVTVLQFTMDQREREEEEEEEEENA